MIDIQLLRSGKNERPGTMPAATMELSIGLLLITITRIQTFSVRADKMPRSNHKCLTIYYPSHLRQGIIHSSDSGNERQRLFEVTHLRRVGGGGGGGGHERQVRASTPHGMEGFHQKREGFPRQTIASFVKVKIFVASMISKLLGHTRCYG